MVEKENAVSNSHSATKSGKSRFTRVILPRYVRKLYSAFTTPIAIIMLSYSQRVHPAYNFGWWKRIFLGCRFCWNNYRVTSGTSWRAHMVMAMRLLEMPPQKPGMVIECGCYKGGASVNLSLACRVVGRKFRIYDSFEGLPPVSKGDYVAEDAFKDGYIPGIYEGKLEEVKANIERYGAIDVCQFRKGWFDKTLPKHQGKIALAFIDVDYCSSLHDCLINLWPHITKRGFLYMDEYRAVPYCSVFYSEKYWEKYFDEDPPGLIGIGTGVQVGNFFTTPGKGKGLGGGPSLNAPQSIAFTMKGSRAKWDYYPDEVSTDVVDSEAATSV